MRILLLLNDKTTYEVTEQDIIKWSELYPKVDVKQELRGMIGWLDANPKNRKTRRGVKRFINGWLKRAQDSGGVSPIVKKMLINENGPTPTRNMSAEDELCDISWLNADRKPAIRALFLKKYGHVFEG